MFWKLLPVTLALGVLPSFLGCFAADAEPQPATQGTTPQSGTPPSQSSPQGTTPVTPTGYDCELTVINDQEECWCRPAGTTGPLEVYPNSYCG